MLLHWDDGSADDIDPMDADALSKWHLQVDPTRTAFMDLGARLGSFDQGEPFASWFVRQLGFNLPKASGNLRQLGIWFGVRGEERADRFQKLDAGLKFQANPNKSLVYNPHNIGR